MGPGFEAENNGTGSATVVQGWSGALIGIPHLDTDPEKKNLDKEIFACGLSRPF